MPRRSFVFSKPVLIGGALVKGMLFGLMVIAVKIFPRFFDMWIQTTYPNRLLAVEFVNGAIGGVVIGLTLAFII